MADIEPLPLATLLGIEIVGLTPDEVRGTLRVRADLCTRRSVLHGGAIMAFALGDVAHAECTPLHRGQTTMVWQTKISRGDGKLAAVVTQTQLVMPERG